MQCVVLSGGLGTRMSRFTSDIPKALIPVNGVPFLEFQLRQFENSGINKVTLCIGYKGEMIEEFVSNRNTSNMDIRCIYDGDQLLGTGGALRSVLDLGELEEVFMLTYGDSYLTCDYQEIYSSFTPNKFESLMVVQSNVFGYERSNVAIEGDRVSHYSKTNQSENMHWIDYGLSVLKSSIIRELVPSSGSYDISMLFEALSISGKLEACETKERYYEIGSEIGLEAFKAFLMKNDPQ